jgi:hypothetical protein
MNPPEIKVYFFEGDQFRQGVLHTVNDTETKVYFFKDNQLCEGLVKAVVQINLNGVNTTAYFVLDPESSEFRHLQD